MKRILSILLLTGLITATRARAGEEYIQLPAAIHIASSVSDGRYSLAQLAGFAEEAGVRAVIITDRDMRRWEYGLAPLRRLIAASVEHNSILRYGAQRWLSGIKAVQDAHPGLILIAGIESAPFYYWQGSPFDGTLTLRESHKHLLVIGLNEAKQIHGIPVVGNWHALARPLSGGMMLRAIPFFAIVAAGVVLLRKRKYPYRDASGRRLGPLSRGWLFSGALMIVVGLLLIFNAYPFGGYVFDQYRGDRGIMPYQQFIDYANAREALTFWVHPEASYLQEIKNVRIETAAYPDDLRRAQGYTGFEFFYGGDSVIGRIGGVWDDLLTEYCMGRRSHPVWAIAGIGLEAAPDPVAAIADCRTVLMCTSADRGGVMEALKAGRIYAIKGGTAQAFKIDAFLLRAASGGRTATMGGLLAVNEAPLLEVAVSLAASIASRTLTLNIVKDGRLVKSYPLEAPFRVVYQDEAGAPGTKSFYRIEVKGSGLHAVSNPVFVEYRQ